MNTNQPLQWVFVSLVTVLLVSAVKAGPTPAPQTSTGIEGVITISPSQPGPTRVGVPDSKGLPNMEFVVENGNGTVASFTTDENGKFRIELPPGHYTVSRKGGKHTIGRYGPFEADVVTGKATKVSWSCDSGMR